MGANKSTAYYDPTINAQLYDQTKQCKFYRNQQGEQFQKYKVKNKGNNDFQNRYQFRIKNNSPYLVDAYSSKSSDNAFGCASGDQYQIVTQRIPIRLSDLNNLSGRQAINIVNKSLKGFQQIYKSQGVLLVKDSMIGLNRQNNVKVWMNSNFALNQIEKQPISYGVLSESQKQSTMVDNIVELINSRTRRDPQWVQFVDQKYRQGRIGFQQAINLSQVQASRYNILSANNSTPQFVQSVSNIQNSFVNSSQIPNSQIKVNNNPISISINPTNTNQPPQIQQSYLKRTNQTVAASVVNPFDIITNNSKNSSIYDNPQNRQNRMINQSSGISSVKNRIINGPTINTNTNNPNAVVFNPNIIRSQQIQQKVSNLTPLQSERNNIINNPVQTPRSIQTPNFNLPTQPLSIPQPILNTNQTRAQFNQTPISYNPPPPQNIRPRPLSQGKPIVTFGNKTISSGIQTTSFQQNFRPLAQINPQTPQFNSMKVNNFNNLQLNKKISNPSSQNITKIVPQSFKSEQNKQIIPNQQLQLNPVKAPQICPPEQVQQIQRRQIIVSSDNNYNQNQQNRNIETTTKNNNVKYEQINVQQTKNNQYPHPYNIVNFQKKIQVTQSKYQANPQSIPISISYNSQTQNRNLPTINQPIPQQKISQKMDQSSKINQQIQKLQNSSVTTYKNRKQTNNYASSQFVNPTTNQKQDTNNQKQKQYLLRSQNDSLVIKSVQPNKTIQQVKQNNVQYETNKKQNINQSIKIKNQDTPYFGRQKFVNKNLFNQNHDDVIHEDQMLANQQYQLKILKQSKQQQIKAKQFQAIAQNKKIDQILTKKQSNKQKIQQKLVQIQTKISQNKNMTNSQSRKLNNYTNQNTNIITNANTNANTTKNVNIKSEDLRDQKNFKKAVQQTASNIRMQASKISIRSSSDLKGIISYKDLRDLLKTTKKA